MHRSLIFCILFVINFTCTNNDDSEEYLVRLETDKNSYVVDTLTTIYLDVLNEGKSPVYFSCMGIIFLNEYENGSLNKSWMVHGFEKCGASTMEPNSTRIIDLYFLQWEELPDAKFNETVAYKLNIHLYKDKDLNQPLNAEDQISDYFKIIRE